MRNRFHSLCPYFAMFPESFAATWIERLTAPGDLILDPFCGRGTAPFQALTMGRSAVANDINPVAYCITRAKTNAPTSSSLAGRLTRLEQLFREQKQGQVEDDLPDFFRHAYSPETLREILFLRSRLRWRASDVDCMLAALTLGILHGESQKSPTCLSNQMPRTISTKPEYSIRFWRKRGLVAPRRKVFSLLRECVAFRYESQRPEGRATVIQGDFRSLPAVLRKQRKPIRLAVTSPPYLDTTNFEEDQWLRIWFLGGAPHPTYGQISRDDRHDRLAAYWGMISDVWRVLGLVLAKNGFVVFRLGGKKLTPDRIVKGLEASSVFSGRSARLVSSEVSLIQKRQTGAFRPGSTGCVQEVDCCFELA